MKEKKIRNYQCIEYNGIKWIRYDHYLDALNAEGERVLDEVINEIKRYFKKLVK